MTVRSSGPPHKVRYIIARGKVARTVDLDIAYKLSCRRKRLTPPKRLAGIAAAAATAATTTAKSSQQEPSVAHAEEQPLDPEDI